MLPHTGLFLLWKVALQIRIRRRLKSINCFFRRPCVLPDKLLLFQASVVHQHNPLKADRQLVIMRDHNQAGIQLGFQI